MLKSTIAAVLERSLGKYVHGLNAEALNLSIWSGKVQISSLRLKKEAIDELHLPVVVNEGSIGRISVSIPWKNLWGEPVTVEISDVSLALRRRSGWDWDKVPLPCPCFIQ